jgi:peptide/nickel transport system substrate-binding protein
LLVFLALTLASCAAPPRADVGREPTAESASAPSAAQPARTLTVAFRYEKNDLSTKTLTQAGQEYRMLLNAGPAVVDGTGAPRPYLVERLPQLNSDAWRVSPDGRMETTYRLRPNLTWHDGQPLTADDFVFAWRVYRAPGLGIFSPQPQDHMAEVLAVDSRTFVIRWGSLYGDAALLTSEDLPPLPRHILGSAFEVVESDPAAREAFVNHRYWTSDYVAVGPFRLEHLEPGAGVDVIAFDGHALGRPKIDRIAARLVADENTVLSGVLSGAIHVATSITLRLEHAQVLNREWAVTKGGTVAMGPARLVGSIVQFRPDYQKTPALLDVRVRKALVHAVDRQALNDGILDGLSINPVTYVNPAAPYYAEVDRALVKYPYDPRRTEQLMTDAGFTRDREDFFAYANGERFRPDYQVLTGTTFERGGAITTDVWRRAGIETQYQVLPAVQVRQNEVRNTFPGMSTPGGISVTERAVAEFFTSEQIGAPGNGWAGSNRGGWASSDYDAVFHAFNETLDPGQRSSQVARMMRILSEEVPGFPLYFDFNVMAYVASVHGPDLGIIGSTTLLWNVHEWEMR